MTKSKTLIFFGTEDFSAASLRALINQGWHEHIHAVVTKPDFKKGRGQSLSQPQIKAVAKTAGIPVWQPHSLAEIASQISAAQPQIGVLVAYGKIIPRQIIELFPSGIVNLHPSLLPKYRGPAPIEFAILNGDKETGLSLMQLVPQMDAGPVYLQAKYPLNGLEDRLTLYKALAEEGANLLAGNLEVILSGELETSPQDDTQASYTRLLTKQDGIVDWSQPATVIERQVRAYLGYPRSRATINTQEIIITKARIAQSLQDGALVKACAEGFLEIQELIGPSGKSMSGADFIRGYS